MGRKKVKVNTEGNSLLPEYLDQAHDLCFLNHDILVELLRSGEEERVFFRTIEFSDDQDRKLLEDLDDIFEWLDRTGRVSERNKVLRQTVFPALLSDFLHFIYEALNCSKKAKLAVTYSLIRKPIQESLFLFEVMANNLDGFCNYLIDNPLRLRARHAGGTEVHKNRISKVLTNIGESDRFNAEYLAQLRYEKTDDGFDGSCNTATHLFTQHEAIKTDNMNINFIFIFSDDYSRITQWYFLYSRLPYILCYSRTLIENVFSTFTLTDPNYLENLERRVMAGTLIWSNDVHSDYMNEYLEQFSRSTKSRLLRSLGRCSSGHFERSELAELMATGELG